MVKQELFEKVKRALFEDWRKTKLKADGTYDEKLYKVTSQEFIKRCKEQNLCKYEEMEDGTFKASIATLPYEQQPKYDTESKEDTLLFDLCMKGMNKKEIARALCEVRNEENNLSLIYDDLSEEETKYFYNEIDICMKIIKDEK